MNKILVIIACVFIGTTWAATICDQKLGKIVEMYERNGVLLIDAEVYDCSTLAAPLDSVFGEETDTNAPEVYNTQACIIALRKAEGSLDDIAVFDTENNFELVRSFNKLTEDFSSSRFGDRYTGTILFIKHEWDKNPDDWKYITRVNFDQESGQARLYRWKLGFFWNKYSHDYTVQCFRK